MTSVDTILRWFQLAKDDRYQFSSTWQDVANLVLPTRDFTVIRTQGTQRTNQIYNATAPQAHESASAAMYGLLVNPAIRWFALAPDDYDASLDDDASAWLYDATSRMLAYLGSQMSGFSIAGHEVCLDLMAFGTAVELMLERDGLLKFQARNLASIYLRENDAGDVIEVHRTMSPTARDAADLFGQQNLSDRTKNLLQDPKNAETKVEILHCVWKRTEYDGSSQRSQNMPWGSSYIETANRHQIGPEGGFLNNPYLTPRWSKAPQETYGRSPAMSVLPSIKVVNAMSRTVLMAGEIATRPPINVPANGTEGPIRITPGSINYYRAGTRDFASPMLTGADPRIGIELVRNEELKIEAAFFLDNFKLPDAQPGGGQPRMTAAEIYQRRQQGLLMSSPMLSRAYAEWLNPAVISTFQWMKRTNRFTPVPARLQGRKLAVHYTSPMALSQRASESDGFSQAMQTSNSLLTLDPAVVQNLDSDAAFRAIFQMFGNDPKLMRKIAEVKKMRADQAALQQAAAQSSLVQGGAMAARNAAAGLKDAGLVNNAA